MLYIFFSFLNLLLYKANASTVMLVIASNFIEFDFSINPA
jgi:hypothetical protein